MVDFSAFTFDEAKITTPPAAVIAPDRAFDFEQPSSIKVISDNKCEASPAARRATFDIDVLKNSSDDNSEPRRATLPHWSSSDPWNRTRRDTISTIATQRRDSYHRELGRSNIGSQRGVFWTIISILNSACLLAALLLSHSGWVFIFFIVIKSKDCICALISICATLLSWARRKLYPPVEVDPQWILTLIPAYSESEEDIVACLKSLANNKYEPHEQVFCIILDGHRRDIARYLTRTIAHFSRPHTSFKHKANVLEITAGFYGKSPVIIIQKQKNMGKKDSLILCFDLFNYARASIPENVKDLRDEIYCSVLPDLTREEDFNGFDMIFCTDADSALGEGAIASLTEVIARNPDAIASCGLVLAKNPTYTFWKLFQHYQYVFGQLIRRRAESVWGRVTCLPGCATMIAVRPECGPAIEKYAQPVDCVPILRHQVQYLGTDRRLTYCLLSQGRHLQTILVPDAISDTAPPESIKHYMSQRRRWGTNAYFNNFYFLAGHNQILWTRWVAFMELLRMSLIYYRVANTIMLVKNIVVDVAKGTFNPLLLIPLLIVSQLPTIVFVVSIVANRQLRKQIVYFIVGFFVNKCASFPLSIAVFTNVAKNVGSHGEFHPVTVVSTTDVDSVGHDRLDACRTTAREQSMTTST